MPLWKMALKRTQSTDKVHEITLWLPGNIK